MANQSNALVERLISIFDDVLAEEGWESSFLLRVSKKRLLKAREHLVKEREMQKHLSPSLDGRASLPLEAGQVKVYISLYQAGGHNLVLWEQMLKVLGSCSLGRPIYYDESALRAMISARPDAKKEAYVEVVISSDFIIDMSQAKQPKDINGIPLITLKSGAITASAIRRFVHANKTEYIWINGRLVLA